MGAREHSTARTEEFDPHDEPTGLLLAFSYPCLHLGLLVQERKCCVRILIPKQPPFSGVAHRARTDIHGAPRDSASTRVRMRQTPMAIVPATLASLTPTVFRSRRGSGPRFSPLEACTGFWNSTERFDADHMVFVRNASRHSHESVRLTTYAAVHTKHISRKTTNEMYPRYTEKAEAAIAAAVMSSKIK